MRERHGRARRVTQLPREGNEGFEGGLKYASATGEEIANEGEVTIPMITAEGTKRKMTMQAAGVAKPLASVKMMCEAGHVVVFDEDGSYMLNKLTGEVNYFREEAGNYMLDVWVPPIEALPFGRP